MSQFVQTRAIPRDVAMQLCSEIRAEHRGRWYTLRALRCWGCVAFCNGDFSRMCAGSRSDNRGCDLVNQRYDQQIAAHRSKISLSRG